MMELKKIGNIEVKNEPYLKPVSNEGIGFYNLDDKTAVLRFHVTKNEKPLLISKENAETYIYLESTNGSNQVVEEVNFIDSMNGIAEIIIPIEFLQASTSTTVTGQIYITVNQFNEVDDRKSATAVLTEFSFDVADARINKINGTTKISYIRMFDELKKLINERAEEIQRQLDNMEDYIVKVRTATEEGITQIQSESKKGVNQLTDLNNKSLKNIERTLNAATQTIDNLYEDYDNELANKAEQYLKDLRVEVLNIQNILGRDGYITQEQHENENLLLKEQINTLKASDSDWITFDLINGAVKDRHYKATGQNGFNCSYRTIKHPTFIEKVIRINADNFDSGSTIAKLPENFVTNTQTAFLRSVPSNAGGAQVVIEPSGDVEVWICHSDKWSVSKDAYIYGELKITE